MAQGIGVTLSGLLEGWTVSMLQGSGFLSSRNTLRATHTACGKTFTATVTEAEMAAARDIGQAINANLVALAGRHNHECMEELWSWAIA